jgi:tyrosine-specific transport protein
MVKTALAVLGGLLVQMPIASVSAFSLSQYSSASILTLPRRTRPRVRQVSQLHGSVENDEELRVITVEMAAAEKRPYETESPSFWQSLRDSMGSVDDSRIIYPEIDSGEVNRLFSSLQYTQNSQNQVVGATHAPGSVMGAAALVTGTTVGAGVLALPAATFSTGFVPSTVALLIAYVIMNMSGLLIAELTLNQIGRTGRPGLGLLELYKASLGQPWSAIGTMAYFFLHYSVLVAYITQGGTNLESIFGLPNGSGDSRVIFATVLGMSLLLAKPAWIEQFNNLMVFAVGASFFAIVGIGAKSANFDALLDPANQHPDAIVSCFPIMFLSLVFHNVVPTIVNNLEGDRGKITQAIICGTTAPFLMFLAWNAVCLGNTAGILEAMDGTRMDPVVMLQSGAAGGTLLAPLVTIFSVMALITSIIGFTYGLVEAWTDVFGINQKSESFSRVRPALFALVYGPPLALSVADPNIFYTALDYGGAFGVTTLFLVLPALMVWKERYQDQDTPLVTKPMVGLGKLPLICIWLVAGALILEQAAEKSGVLQLLQNTVTV